MKKALFFTILFLIGCNKRYKPNNEEGLAEIECGWFGKKTIEERRSLFPFNNAANVLLIYFIDYGDKSVLKRRIDDSIPTPWGEKLPPFVPKNKKKQFVILDTFIVFNTYYLATEIIELNQHQLDSLSYLVLNYKFNKVLKGGYTTFKGCYSPRNAILFFDKNNKPILDFEICFECGHIYLYPTGEHFHYDNVQCFNTELYRAFFKQCNVHYGVDSLKN